MRVGEPLLVDVDVDDCVRVPVALLDSVFDNDCDGDCTCDELAVVLGEVS